VNPVPGKMHRGLTVNRKGFTQGAGVHRGDCGEDHDGLEGALLRGTASSPCVRFQGCPQETALPFPRIPLVEPSIRHGSTS